MPYTGQELLELIVPFKDDLLALPAQFCKLVAVGGDHVVEAADVSVDIEPGRLDYCDDGCGMMSSGTLRDNSGDVLLYIATKAFPALILPTEA